MNRRQNDGNTIYYIYNNNNNDNRLYLAEPSLYDQKENCYVMLHRDQRGGGTCACDHGVACSRPDPSAALSTAYIVAQCRRLADHTYSGETRRVPPEAPTSMKLLNQTHWSHFGE